MKFPVDLDFSVTVKLTSAIRYVPYPSLAFGQLGCTGVSVSESARLTLTSARSIKVLKIRAKRMEMLDKTMGRQDQEFGTPFALH